MRRMISVSVFLITVAVWCQAEGWRLDIGGGLNFGDDYPGSNSYGLSPLPIVEARYVGDSAEFFAGTLNGVGMDYSVGDSGFDGSVGVDFGESRDGDIENYVRGFGSLGWSRSLMNLTAEASYYPIEFDGRWRQGFCLEPTVSFCVPFCANLHAVTIKAGASFMNGEYSKAWFGSDEVLLGPRSAFLKTDIALRGLLPHTMLCGSCSIERLVGNAASSERTKSAFSYSTSIFAAYRFKKR